MLLTTKFGGKILFCAKVGKISPNGSNIFCTLYKILSLVFPGKKSKIKN